MENNNNSENQKQRFGAKHLDESTTITTASNGRIYNVKCVTGDGLMICLADEVEEATPRLMKFPELAEKFENNKLHISGYEHTPADLDKLNLVIREVELCHDNDSKNSQISELETTEEEFKSGGVIGKIKYNKNGAVKEIRNQYGKLIKEIKVGDNINWVYNPKTSTYHSGMVTLSRGYMDDVLSKGIPILKKGGSIINQYEGLTPEEVWTKWTPEQKTEFLVDHANEFKYAFENFKGSDDSNYTTWGSIARSIKTYDELPVSVKNSLRIHVKDGQYKKGGKTITQAEIDETAKRIVQNGVCGVQTSLVEKLLKDETIPIDDIQNFYVYPEWSKKVVGESLFFEGGSYEEREAFLEKFTKLIEESAELLEKEEISEATYDRNVELITEAKLEFENDTEESQPQEIYEWWFIPDEWFKEKLLAQGEPIIDNDLGTWWGRTTTGQQIYIDGVISRIAKSILSKKDGGKAYFDKGGDTRYNGWKNYETWNVKLWMDNDSGSQSYWNERATEIAKEAKKSQYLTKKEEATRTLADELKEYHEENNPLSDQPSTYSDLLGSALSNVDWREVAESLLEEKMKWKGGEMAKGGKPEGNVTKKEVKGNAEDGYHFNVYYGGKDTAGIVSASYKTEKEAEDKLETFIQTGKYDLYGTAEMKKGGEAGRSFRYLNLKPTEGGLELSLTDEGKEFAQEKKDEGVADVFIIPDLFDDVQGNSEYIFHHDLGDSGFGLTSAPGITDGYHHSDDVLGAFETDFPKTAKLYYYNDYAIRDMIEEMLEEGKVVLTEQKAKGGYLKQGGKADITPNYYRFRQQSPKGVTECAVPDWAVKVAESVKKGAKITTCKKDGKWFIQSILIPKEGVKPGEAKKLAEEIKNKFSRKKKALGGRAETGTNDEIKKTISGLETLRDTTDNAEEKTKYQDLINELN